MRKAIISVLAALATLAAFSPALAQPFERAPIAASAPLAGNLSADCVSDARADADFGPRRAEAQREELTAMRWMEQRDRARGVQAANDQLEGFADQLD